MDEILNIEHHVKNMIVRALNISKDVEEASNRLGISVRTLQRYRKVYGVGKNKVTGSYYLKPQKNIILPDLLN